MPKRTSKGGRKSAPAQPTKNPFGVIGNARMPASGNKPAVARPARRVSISPAGRRRARSVGVSSSSRQRTNKRGR